METMSAHEAERKYHAARKTAPRRASATTLVAGLYVLLVLGAPLIVRYGPELAATRAPAIAAAGSPCATVGKSAAGCLADIPIVR